MRLSKFSLSNRLSLHGLAGLVAVRSDETFSEGVDLRRTDRFVPCRLSSVLEIPPASARERFCLFTGHPAPAWWPPNCVMVPRALIWASTWRGFSGDLSSDPLPTDVACDEDAANELQPYRMPPTAVWQRSRGRAPPATRPGSNAGSSSRQLRADHGSCFANSQTLAGPCRRRDDANRRDAISTPRSGNQKVSISAGGRALSRRRDN